jgi:hypothetical protein
VSDGEKEVWNMEQFEMEKLEKVLEYVNRMADGMNPVTGNAYEEDTVLNDPEVIRCMFCVKEILTAVKYNGGMVGARRKLIKKDFPLDTLETFQYVEDKTITKVVGQINEGVDGNVYEKLSYKTITDWLKGNGYLEEVQDEKLGKRTTVSTGKGNDIGITHSLQTNMSGAAYYRVVYDQRAQEFLIKTLPEMLKKTA